MNPQEELEEARQAYQSGQLSIARMRLNAAKMAGADPNAVRDLAYRIDVAERTKHHVSHHYTVTALVIAGIGYLVLATRPPGNWPISLWAFLSFCAIPVVQGILLGWGAHPGYTRLQRFWNGWVLAAMMMGAYSFFSLLILNEKIPSHPAAEVIVFVTVVYGAIAGVVAGVVSASFRRRPNR